MDKEKIKEFFDRLSDGWDEGLAPDENKIDTILDFAGLKENDSVLDIACGTGVMFNYYFSRGAACVTGVDISEKMLAVAKSKFSCGGRLELICADAEEYSFSKKYDCCVIFNAFPHFCNPEALVKNLAKALKTGGRLTVAHDCSREELDRHHMKEASGVSQRLMSEDDLAALLKKTGFTDVKIKADSEIFIVSGTII